MKTAFLDKLIERMDRIDANSLQSHFLHLSQEKGLLETIFHALHEGVIGIDGESRIIYANRSAGRLLGFDPVQVAGEEVGRYLRDIEWNLIMDLDDNEWTRLVNREIEVTYPEHRYLAFYIVPVAIDDSEERGAVILLRDVTTERKKEEHTIESERFKAITLLAAGVAHEIGNPLNSLTIHLQLLERELEGLPAEKQETISGLIEVARKEVQRLDQIIQKFLGAVRPVEPQLERTSLNSLLKESLQFLDPEIKDRNVLVEVDVEKAMPTVLVDAGQIKQVFYNLIKNAVEAMDGGGILKINIYSTDLFAAVSFRDTGPGITSENIGTVFDAYNTTKKRGSGLGLMIVQRIMRDHGGEIEIDSAPGHGTTITIYIPLTERRMRLLKSGKGSDQVCD